MKSNLTSEHYKWLMEHSYSDKESCLGIYIDDIKGFIKCYSVLIDKSDDRDFKGRLINPLYKYKYFFKLELLDLPFKFVKEAEDIKVDGIEYYLSTHREDRYGIETTFNSYNPYTQENFEKEVKNVNITN